MAEKKTATAKAGLDPQTLATLDWSKLIGLLMALLSLFAVTPPPAQAGKAKALDHAEAARHKAACDCCLPGLWDYLAGLDYNGLVSLWKEMVALLTPA